MIIETSANQLYVVNETHVPGLDHVWYGLPVKLHRASGAYLLTAVGERAYKNGTTELVRKAGCRIVAKTGSAVLSLDIKPRVRA